MTTTSLTQIFNNASSLQVALATLEAAGRAHRQYALHVTRSAFALCPKAALTPQYALTDNTLSKIVGRVHTLILYKCPKMLAMLNNPAAFAAQGAFTSACLFKKLFHTLCNDIFSGCIR